MYIKSFTAVLLTLFFLTGCAEKTKKAEETFNKPAVYWYQEIIKNIKAGTLDKADDAYASLSSEHVASPLLEEALMILARAHSEEDEHILAKFYIDSYIKRYAKSTNVEYLKFLGLKSNFGALKKPKRDQKLILDTIDQANNYLERFPDSSYNPLVHTMLTKLHLAELVLNRDIAALYKKTDKKSAAKIYQDKIDSSWLKETPIDLSDQGIFSKVFD
ncbi:MAG: outer membrane protein assembly factor BamD [Epsilonproteobacteria bacterium]|nr:outer membrane protein assembly factor BamD [Campylobacterota bacterium]